MVSFIFSELINSLIQFTSKKQSTFGNVNGILTSNGSTVGCLEDSSCFVSSEEACTLWEAKVANNFWTFCNLQSWLRIQSPGVTQTSVLHCIVFMNPKFAVNFPYSILGFHFSALNPLNANVALIYKPVNRFACGASKGFFFTSLKMHGSFKNNQFLVEKTKNST